MFKEEFRGQLYSVARDLIVEVDRYCPGVRCWMEDEEMEELISYFTKCLRKDIEIINDGCKER